MEIAICKICVVNFATSILQTLAYFHFANHRFSFCFVSFRFANHSKPHGHMIPYQSY